MICKFRLLNSSRNSKGGWEPHEIHERLRRTPDRIRAFGMPLPDDHIAPEKELAEEFERQTKVAGQP